MFKNIQIFFVFLLLSQSLWAGQNLWWKPVTTPEKIDQIIGGTSINNYWVLDNQHHVLHYENARWKSFNLNPFSSLKNNRLVKPFVIDSNRIMVIINDIDWRSHIVEIDHEKMKYYRNISNYPLYNITKMGNVIYATGNFGAIYQLKNHQWQKFKSPITSHIHAVYADQKKKILWMGTKTEGLFSWDGKKLEQYEIPENEANISIGEIEKSHDTLFVNIENNQSYFLSKNKFQNIAKEKTPFYTPIKPIETGFLEIKTSKEKSYMVPYSIEMKSFKKLEDGHILLLSFSNQLYVDETNNYNFFTNFAPVCGIEGPHFNFSVSNAFIPFSSIYRKIKSSVLLSDFNSDGYTDVLLFNISEGRKPFFFLNSSDQYFTNYSEPYGLTKLSFNSFFSYAMDLDGDFVPEIVSSDFKNNHYYLNIFKKSARVYKKTFTYQIPRLYATNPTQSINFTDINNDGNLDVALIYGYSTKGEGAISFIYNNGYGQFHAGDTTHETLFTGWNVKSIFADFNNDGFTDVFLLRNWSNDLILFKNPSKPNEWFKKTITTPDSATRQQRKIDALAFDYDNDGDLDIISLAEIPFITLYENNGKGHFTNVTATANLDFLNKTRRTGQLNIGDFDNNGFLDLFISSISGNKKTYSNFILLNDGKKKFHDQSSRMGIENGHINFAVVGDIDNDGDLDIYGYKPGENVYWKNNLNNNNFLQIKPIGIKSNSEAIGTKIWVFNKDQLMGYRQVGSMLTGLLYQNQNLVHFGLQKGKEYNVRVLFPSGKMVTYYNVQAGQRMVVKEINAPFSWFFTIDNKINDLLHNEEFLAYSLIIFLGFFVLISCIVYGMKKFNWDVPLTTLIISLNLLIFGILLNAFSQYTSIIRYVLPLSIIFAGSLSSIGFYLWIKNLFSKKSKKEKEFVLFQTLINFSHGSWAQSNLNSLLLLYENISIEEIGKPEYQESFNKRKETFFHLTLPAISKLADEARNIKDLKEIATDIEGYKKQISQILNQKYVLLKEADIELFSTNINRLLLSISKLKKRIFSEHSCNPESVIKSLDIELQKLRNQEDIDFKTFYANADAELRVLMEPIALADIIENCVHNALKALYGKENKKLTIKLLNNETRVMIEIIDNGCGIPENLFEMIFQNGYSTTKSTGYGLYYSKKVLAKYGGRIYVKNSIPDEKTTLVIELQKNN